MRDLISRQAAIKNLTDEYHGMISDESMKVYQIIDWLNSLPSAEKTGEWIEDEEQHHVEKTWKRGRMTFKVIDSKTGKEPTSRVIENIAKKGGLMTMDIDGFYLGEDGTLVLADECGNITYCDRKRFRVVVESEGV